MDKNIIPKISVLMPVFNCIQYIKESVDSIINQTFKEFEFIIIDDCSTDGTFEYLQNLSDPRINLIRKAQNSGYTNSLNMGLKIAKGVYIARMDGDDISLPDRFAKQISFMDENSDTVVCGGGYEAIGLDFKFVPKSSNDEIVLELMYCSPFAHPTVFMRNNILKEYNIQYNPKYEPAEDYKLWTKLSEYGKLANLNDVLLYYRVHQNQTTNLRSNSQREITKLITFEYLKNLSKNNINTDIFCKINIDTKEDLKKYENVEVDIKTTLKERGIIINDTFFLNRKIMYLKNSLIHKRNTIPQALKDLKFIFRFRHLLDNKFIIKHLAKCFIYRQVIDARQ
jgi:glycosyltransferase involved in cell wall biosynthesis